MSRKGEYNNSYGEGFTYLRQPRPNKIGFCKVGGKKQEVVMALTTYKSAEAEQYHINKREREFQRAYYWDDDMGFVERERKRVVQQQYKNRNTTAPRRTGHLQREEGSRSSAKSGDGNKSDPEPEPERCNQQYQLYNQQTLADLLGISKKTLQNRYSLAPYTLPAAIAVPGARGPRWTYQSIHDWLTNQPRHTTQTAPVAPKRKAGRPRIVSAVAKAGVQS